MSALSTYDTLKNLTTAVTQLTDFINRTVDLRSTLESGISPIDDPKTKKMLLEINQWLGNKAIEFFEKLWQQICKDNGFDPDNTQVTQLAEHPNLVFSEEAGKRLQEFQAFIKAN